MAKVGDTKVNKLTGQRAVFDGQNWRAINSQPQTAGGGNSAFNRGLDAAAAKDVMQSRQNASGAVSRLSEAEGIINRLDQTPQGFTVPTRLKMGGLLMSAEGKANARVLDRFAGTAAIGDAAALKPLSNSDMQFLMSQQAGAGENKQTNEAFLRARQWADFKALGKNAAQDVWIKKLGSPNAMNRNNQSFDTWWSGVENQFYPRPNMGEHGSYRPAAGRKSAPMPQGQARIRKYNPVTGNIE